jgi:hypothetical protein
MHVLGVVYLMKRSEWGLAAWCLVGSWWCVLWIRNKLPLSNMPSSTRYNGSTGFGRFSPLGGAGEQPFRICSGNEYSPCSLG